MLFRFWNISFGSGSLENCRVSNTKSGGVRSLLWGFGMVPDHKCWLLRLEKESKKETDRKKKENLYAKWHKRRAGNHSFILKIQAVAAAPCRCCSKSNFLPCTLYTLWECNEGCEFHCELVQFDSLSFCYIVITQSKIS